ncbi:MAG: lytic transglycosylase [Pseudomonadota bacterium]
MSRFLCISILALLVGCSGGGGKSPRNLDNACSIVSQRPEYLEAFRQTERKWGVPVAVQMATIYQESKFISDARTPYQWSLGVIPMGRMSSAYGYSQALDGTWEEYQEETRRPRAKRDSIDDATDFMGWYMTLTQERNGISLGDARNQYLAYHDGHTGYARGSYRSKPWLMRIAGEIEARAALYDTQLKSCGKI